VDLDKKEMREPLVQGIGLEALTDKTDKQDYSDEDQRQEGRYYYSQLTSFFYYSLNNTLLSIIINIKVNY